MDQPIRPASRESTDQTQRLALAHLIKRYLVRRGYKVDHLSPEQVCRRLEHDYRTLKISQDGKTLNEIVAERERK